MRKGRRGRRGRCDRYVGSHVRTLASSARRWRGRLERALGSCRRRPCGSWRQCRGRRARPRSSPPQSKSPSTRAVRGGEGTLFTRGEGGGRWCATQRRVPQAGVGCTDLEGDVEGEEDSVVEDEQENGPVPCGSEVAVRVQHEPPRPGHLGALPRLLPDPAGDSRAGGGRVRDRTRREPPVTSRLWPRDCGLATVVSRL